MKTLAGWITAVSFILMPAVAFTAGQPIRVRVVDAETGKPVAGARGGVDSSDEVIRAASNGELRLSATFPTDVWAEAPGYLRGSIAVRAKSDGAIELPLTRALSLRGVVTDPAGKGVAGVSVWASNLKNHAWSDSARTDSKGRFLMTRLGPGTTEVRVSRGMAEVIRHVDLPAAQPLTVTWGTGLLRVKVTAGDEPVADATVRLKNEALNSSRQLSTGPDGIARLEVASPERLLVQVTAPNFAPAPPRVVELGNEPEVELEFQLVPGGSIRGRVVDAEGKPIAGASVSGRVVPVRGESDWPDPAEVTSDGDGRFTLSNVAERPHRLWVSHPEFQGNTSVTATPGGEARVVLQRLASVSGRVVLGGEPVQEFSVNHERFNDPEGRFQLRGVEPGTARLRIEGPFAPATIQIALKPGEARALGDVEVVAAGGIEVIARDGKRPLEGFDIAVAPAGEPKPEEFREWMARARNGRTQSDGRIVFEDLTPGRYVVRGDGDAGVTEPVEIEVKSRSIARVELKPAPGGIVEGVVKGQDARPRAGVNVFLTGATTLRTTRTGPEGRFRITGLPSGTYRLEAVDIEQSLAALENCPLCERGEPVEVVAGKTVRMDVTLGGPDSGGGKR